MPPSSPRTGKPDLHLTAAAAAHRNASDFMQEESALTRDEETLPNASASD